MDPNNLRELSTNLWRILRDTSNELDRLYQIEKSSRIAEDVYDQVVENLAQGERAKLQREMSALRIRLINAESNFQSALELLQEYDNSFKNQSGERLAKVRMAARMFVQKHGSKSLNAETPAENEIIT